MRLIDADQLCEEFKMRQRAALNWKEGATLANNEESIIRADATLAFLSEVKLTIDNAPTVGEKPQDHWIEYKENGEIMYYCSNCMVTKGQAVNNFCACCGAKMQRGGTE